MANEEVIADEVVDIRKDLAVAPGKIKVVVLLGDGSTISNELRDALENVRSVLTDDEVEGFTIFRVNVDKDEAVIVTKKGPWHWRDW